MAQKNNSNYDRNRPKYEWGSKWRGAKPSDKQINYAEILAAKNNIKINWGKMENKGEVNFLINELQMEYRRGFGLFKRDWIDTNKVTDLQEA